MHAGGFHAGGGAMHAGSFHSIAPSHAGSNGQFARNGAFGGHYGNTFAGRYGNTFAGRYGNWAGNHAWDNYFRRGGYGGYGGWGWGGYGGWGGGWGGYWPWYGGWGLGLGWGYPYADSYYYPYAGDYYYSYAPADYGGYYSSSPADYGADYSYAPAFYGDTGASGDSAITAPQQFADSSPAIAEEGGLQTHPSEDQQGSGEALQFYSEARAAFLHGDYQDALRLASHAGVEAPRNSKVHELISLALFALGNYGPAAGEAHAAMALGAIADWKDLFAYYNDAENYTAQLAALEAAKYTTQLRALEKAAAENPKSAAEHFLLGYHYLMIGARDNAKTQFAEAVKLTPGDKLAAHYLQQLQSNSPLTPPQMASRPQGTSL